MNKEELFWNAFGVDEDGNLAIVPVDASQITATEVDWSELNPKEEEE